MKYFINTSHEIIVFLIVLKLYVCSRLLRKGKFFHHKININKIKFSKIIQKLIIKINNILCLP